jgi:uncharacterized membrane protein YraQ (UPF0718 family)
MVNPLRIPDFPVLNAPALDRARAAVGIVAVAPDSAIATVVSASLSFGMSGSAFLAASVGALAAGPVITWFAGHRAQLLALLDGFILVAIGGLVLFDVVPHALQERDLVAFGCLLAGFALPTMAERFLHYGARQTHIAVLILALLGVAIHSALDGSALRQAGANPASVLGYGVLLHQVPVSLTVWWVLRDRPRLVAWAALGLMALTTVIGYVAEPAVLSLMPERAALWFEALVGGSLLHVIGHPAHGADDAHDHTHDHAHNHAHDHAHDHGSAPWTNGVGALIGLALLVWVHLGRDVAADVSVASTLRAFWSLMLDTAPAVLLAYVAAGLLHGFLPASSLTWLSRGSRLRQGMAGMAVGLPLPICSCGVVPLYQQLVQQGASTTAAVAFLVATPELGIDAVLLSVPLLGTPFAVVRVVAAAVAALTVALILGRYVRSRGRALPVAAPVAPQPTIRDRLRQAARTGLGDMVDHTAPWILAGLLLAAFAMPLLEGSWLTRLPTGIDVVAFALLGLPLYICASASTPLVAVLVAAGVSPGAGLALLLTGPATNVATLGILTRMHGRRFAIGFAVAMTVSAVVLGWMTNLFIPSLGATQPAIDAEQLGTPWQIAAVVIVALLYAASVVRRGIRGFLGELRLAESH